MTAPISDARARLRPAAWGTLAVGAALVATAVAGAGALGLGVVAARVGADVVGVACVGLALVAVLLPGPTGPTRHDIARVDRTVDRALLVLGGAWVALVLVGVALRAADAFGRGLGQLGAGEVLAWSTRLAAGRGLVLTAGCALVVLVCAAVRLHDPDRVAVRIPLVAALLGVLTPTVTGHAGSAP
ncbi:hypothetical protein I4I73_18205, partial [Pseudonocardia sp. KRD-184]|nr:hypothetical protein [Pseudonocardia oceani]MBW0124466.1 hypothetical protein [Pseudonocardia oceani]